MLGGPLGLPLDTPSKEAPSLSLPYATGGFALVAHLAAAFFVDSCYLVLHPQPHCKASFAGTLQTLFYDHIAAPPPPPPAELALSRCSVKHLLSESKNWNEQVMPFLASPTPGANFRRQHSLHLPGRMGPALPSSISISCSTQPGAGDVGPEQKACPASHDILETSVQAPESSPSCERETQVMPQNSSRNCSSALFLCSQLPHPSSYTGPVRKAPFPQSQKKLGF